MSKIYYKFGVVSSLFCLTIISCSKDWFDIKSDQNLTVPTSLQDFEYLLDNYDVISAISPALGEIASDGYYITESTWESQIQNNIPFSNIQVNAYTWSKIASYREVGDWNLSFTKIAYCNTVLEGLEKIDIPENQLTKLNEIKGNALFIRAKTNLDLAQLYASPYEANDNEYGLPIVKSTDVTIKPYRSSVHQTYQDIISDLQIAASLLPKQQVLKTRASKVAALAMLSRVFLIMGSYDSALKYSDSALQIYNKILDFNNIPASDYNLGNFNNEVIYHSLMINYYFIIYGYYLIAPELYASYDTNDLRKNIYFAEVPDGITFKGTYSDINVATTSIGTDEIYLIKSESLIRTQKINEGLKTLETLMQHRYKRNENGSSTYTLPTISSETEAINLVIMERRKELIYRGLRWLDLRRINLDPRFKKAIHRRIGNTQYTLEPNSYRYTFPIPDDEISISGLKQNPGW